MVYPNSALNINVGANATIPGSYTTSVPQEVAGFNQVMMKLAEVFDPFIQQSLIAHPRFWYNVIARGAFPNFNGYEHETRVFRGGLQHYAGLQDWSAINPVATTAHNPCIPGGHTTPSYAWESLKWSGYERRWGSDPICLKQLQYIQQAQQQLGWILQVGAEYGVSLQEVWNRDYLIKTAVDADRAYVNTSSYVGNTSAPKFYFNPFTATFPNTVAGNAAYAASTAASKVDPTSGVTGPFVVFSAATEVEPLNFDVLDALHEDLDVSCPGAALSKSGMTNIFGCPVSKYDFERYIKSNPYEISNWRESRSEQLIEGLGMGVKQHRDWAMSFDENQFRAKIVKYVASYAAASYGGVATDLEGEAVFIAQFVAPRIEGRLGEDGVRKIPEFNPEYLTAELAVMPVLMKDVFTNLMGTDINTLGSGTFFGPQAGLNGKWAWTNILSEDKNPEGTIGNFRGRFEIFPKPDPSVVFSTALLYRRCTESIRSRCPVDNSAVDPDSATGAVAAVAYTASGAVVADDTVTVTATLAGKLTDAPVGSAVELKFTGIATGYTGYLIKTSTAPTYQIHVVGLSPLVAKADAVENDYYLDGAVLYLKGADTATSALVLATVEAV